MGRDLVSIGKRAADKERCEPNSAKLSKVSKARGRALAQTMPVLKALADDTRLAIVELLSAADEALCACDIEAAFDVTQSTISHHMRVLKDAGLVDAERKGTWVYYAPTRVARDVVRALVEHAAR